jgi:hypothetical protein
VIQPPVTQPVPQPFQVQPTDTASSLDIGEELGKAYRVSEFTFAAFMVLGMILLAFDSGLGIMEAIISIFFLFSGSAASKASESMTDPPEFLRHTRRSRNLALFALVLLVLYLLVFIYLVIDWEGEGAWGFVIFVFFISLAVYILKKLGPVVAYAKAQVASASARYSAPPAMATRYPTVAIAPQAVAPQPWEVPPQTGTHLSQQPTGLTPPPMPGNTVHKGDGGGQHEHQQQQ